MTSLLSLTCVSLSQQVSLAWCQGWFRWNRSILKIVKFCSSLIALLWVRCVEAVKHLKPAGQQLSRARCGHFCYSWSRQMAAFPGSDGGLLLLKGSFFLSTVTSCTLRTEATFTELALNESDWFGFEFVLINLITIGLNRTVSLKCLEMIWGCWSWFCVWAPLHSSSASVSL